MAIPVSNPQATVGLTEESKQALRNVSDSVKNAGRNFVTNVRKEARVRERVSEGVKATGRGARSAAVGATFAATQNPFAAKTVEKTIDTISMIPTKISRSFSKLTGLFGNKEESAQQKTNENIKQVAKNQTNQKGVFTDILNVLKDIRKNLDTMMGIDREEINLQKEQDREKETQQLLNLEKQREKARQQPRDELGRFMKVQPQNDADRATSFFAGGFFGNMLASIRGALAAMFTVAFWKGALRKILRAGGKIFPPVAIITSIFAGLKGAVEGFMDSEKDTLLGKVFDGVKGAVSEIVEWLSFGMLDSDFIFKQLNKIEDYFKDLIGDKIKEIKNFFTKLINSMFKPETQTGDVEGDVLKNKETGEEYRIKEIGPQGRPGQPNVILENKKTGETKIVPEQSLGTKYKRESSLKQGDSAVKTSQRNVDKAISDAAEEFDVPETALRKMAFFESTMDPTEINKSTGAQGLFQIMPQTEKDIKNNLGVTGDPMKASDASRMAAALTKDEINAFENKYGHTPNAEQLQLIHLLGRPTAYKAFDNPNKDMEDISMQAVKYNRWLKGKNLDEVLVSIGKRFVGTPPPAPERTSALSGPEKTNALPENIEPNPNLRRNMAQRMEESVSNKVVNNSSQSQNNIVAPSIQQDNRQYSENKNFGPPAKSGSTESTFSAANRINSLA